MNQAAWLVRAGRVHADAPAIAVGDTVVCSYGQFARRAAGLAGALRARPHLGDGAPVAIISNNQPDYLDALYGVWHAGLAAVPINAKLHGAEIGWILENCRCTLAFCSAELETAIAAHAPDFLRELIVLGTPDFAGLVDHDPVPMMHRRPDDLAWLFYTSGTTGRPKGAMLSHRNLQAMALGYLSDVDPTATGDSILHGAPLSHGSGAYALPHVGRAGVNIMPESGAFDAFEIATLMGAHSSVSMFAAPTMIKRLVDHDGDIESANIRTIIWGGAPMHVADLRWALERFGNCFAQIYGQAETPMTTTVLSKADIAARDHPRWLERLGSAGIANSCVEVRVGGPDDRELPAGETGEVLVRGDAVMTGYWDNPQASAEALAGGWLHTGDVGVFDDEGYLTLKDRSKDVIISGGSNIYPREVEEVLLRHPHVAEAAVIGRPDRQWGEVVVAYYSGTAATGELDELCLASIARFKRPKDYVRVADLPKNNYGKILKRELRARDAKRAAGE